MAFEYAYCTDGDAIIAVKDYELASGFAPSLGDVVVISGGKISAPTVANGLVTTTTGNLGVSEGNNFEGLGITPKVGKVRLYGDAVYRAPYGAVDGATGGFTPFSGDADAWTALIGTTKAIGKNTANDAGVATGVEGAKYARGFVVDSAGANKLVKITQVDKADGVVYFQFVQSALFTS